MMKRVLSIFLVIVWMTSVQTAPALAKDHAWKLKKNENGIKAYIREVEGSSILEYKGTVVLDAALDEVIRLFEDTPRMTEWFHQCSEARLVDTKSPDERVIYFVMNMPWPVKDRDLVFLSSRLIDSANGTVEYRTSAIKEGYPLQGGKIRMPYLKGYWRFTSLGADRTEVLYQQHSEVGGHIPAWLVNKLAVNIPFEGLSNFRKILSGIKTKMD